MSTTLQEPEEVNPKTNWCCILCIFVVAGGLCFFGVSLALQGDSRTGLVLLVSSGGLLALSICAAIGRFRPQSEEDKTTSALYDDIDDQPPSYRQSWRRSFMRRIKNRNEGGGEDEENTAAENTNTRRGRRKWWQRRGQGGKDEEEGCGNGEETRRGSRQSRRSSYRTANELYSSSSSSCDSLLAGLCGGGARGGAANERHTQSLSNLLDPPSYQDAIAHLDDAAIRKLQSEMCLPTAMQQ